MVGLLLPSSRAAVAAEQPASVALPPMIDWERVPAPVERDGHLMLDFGWLSGFAFDAPVYDAALKTAELLARAEKQIPGKIRQLDAQRVQITGFMLPVKMVGGKVSQLLLLRDQMMCCYGVVPRTNDWVIVHLAEPIPFSPDVPLPVRGRLQVKAMQEEGFLTGIYLLTEARLAEK